MKRIIGITIIVIGFSLIGFGTYSFFEQYDKYLNEKNEKEEKKENVIEGTYIYEAESIIVKDNDNQLIVTINNEEYEFIKNGNYYENSLIGYLLEFKDNELIVTTGNEETRTFIK